MNETQYQIENKERISGIRERAERLDLLAAQYRAVLAAVAEGVILADDSGGVLLANRAARRILRLGFDGCESIVGQPLTALFAVCSPQSQAELSQAVTSIAAADRHSANHSGHKGAQDPGPGAALKSKQADCADPAELSDKATALLLTDGERALQASLTPMQDQQNGFGGTVIVLRDVTTEQQIAQAKNDFVSLVSHELRTPMTSIKGYTDLLLKGAVGALNEQQKNFMTIVKSNVDRMAELVSDLLEVSRLEAGRVQLAHEQLDLASIVYEISQELAETLRQRELTLQFELAPRLPRVYADRGRVIQVLLNLLSNAYRYTPAGGSITVAAHASEDEVQVDVVDTGIGIPAAEQDTIFERFYRADHPVVRQQAGTGLGLPIARSLIEMHGGRLWLCSEENVGSTFSFTLPIYARDRARPGQDSLSTRIG